MDEVTKQALPPIIAQHNSWISLDPVQGCPASCVYCPLQPISLTKQAPRIREDNVERLYQQLKEYQFFNKSVFSSVPDVGSLPIATGNYTDMCMTPANREYLLSLMRIHKQTCPEVPFCVLTKAVLDRDFLKIINQMNIHITFFISLSFLTSDYEKGTQAIESRLNNFRILSEFPNIRAIHWWRPITSISTPSVQVVEQQIELLQTSGAEASVIIGLQYGKKLAEFFSNIDHPLREYFERFSKATKSNFMIFEDWIQASIIKVANERSYPIFHSTACALSYILGRHCYNAKFRRIHGEISCLSSTCPESQKQRCLTYQHSFQSPPVELLKEMAEYLQIPSDKIEYLEDIDTILIKGYITEEQQNFLTQATSFPVIAESLMPKLEWVEDWRTSHGTDLGNSTAE